MHVLVKAAGGISSIEDAEKFDRIRSKSSFGTSRIVKIVKNQSVEEGTYLTSKNQIKSKFPKCCRP